MTNPQKERFCLACAALPVALAGAGTAGTGSVVDKKHARTRRIMIGGGIVVTILSSLLIVYLMTRR